MSKDSLSIDFMILLCNIEGVPYIISKPLLYIPVIACFVIMISIVAREINRGARRGWRWYWWRWGSFRYGR
jgi:hypothetical protein